MESPAARLRGAWIAVVFGLSIAIVGCGTAGAPDAGSTAPTPTTRPASAAPTSPASTEAASPTPTPTADARTSPPPLADLGARLRATIDGVAQPCAMAATETDVWVTGNGPSVLARIDPSTNTIEAQTPMDGSACGIAVGPDGLLWVALLSAGRVVAVDPVTAEVTGTIDGLGAQLWDLKAGFGAIWVVDRSKREVVRIDTASRAVAARIPIGRSGSGLAIAAGAVWVVDDVEATVRRIDPATDAVTATFDLRRGASWFANDDRVLLVANRLDGSITAIDASDSTPEAPIAGSRSPLDGTVAGPRAYIPDGSAGGLIEIDLETRAIARVDRLEGARNPFVAEFAFADVWVLDYGGRRIWRISP